MPTLVGGHSHWMVPTNREGVPIFSFELENAHI